MILIPVGTIEWHADHLPLGVDCLLAVAVCEEISRQTGCLVAPLLPSGICRDLAPERGYYGTLDTIREQTLSSLVADLLAGYAKMGFQQAVLLSGHFETEHFSAIMEGINQAGSIHAAFLTALDFIQDQVQELEDLSLTWPYAGDHAAEWETSMMMAFFPELVHMENAPEVIELGMPGLPEYLRKRYPRRASLEYGREIRRAVVAGGVKRIQQLLDACTINN